MPVDPGNLLMLGTLGQTTVIGIPSCAASPKLNGFDWVLERWHAGLAVDSATIGRMGVGGLLKEIPGRPQPRTERAANAIPGTRQAPRIGCVLLAAGRSSRMGDTNKLIEDLDGRPIVRHAAEAALASGISPVVVVTGHQQNAVRSALAGLDVAITHNPDFASGLASSLRTGLAALPPHLDGAFIALGDMPNVSAADYAALIAAFSPVDQRAIVVPVVGGKRGNPVLWSARYFTEMQALEGDSGARHLIGAYADAVAEVMRDGDATLVDVDTPEALARVRSARRGS
jgi:molybdenum cofactor cytidylyltransferase